MLHRGVEDATSLQHILSILLSSALATNAELAASHDKAMDTVKARADEGFDTVLSKLATVAASSSALEEHIVSLTTH